MKYGWRLTRKLAGDGSSLLEWRCPKCWARYREAAGVAGGGKGGGT